jgi:glycosyltransferase involved in cell wall biosynthesis
MKVALTSRFLAPTGGTEMQMLQMSRELASRGHQIDLLYNQAGELNSDFEAFCHSMSKVPTFYFSKNRAPQDLLHLAPAVWASVRARPDVVYVNTESEMVFGLLAGFASRAPAVCHLHGTVLTKEEIEAGMTPRLFARARAVIACSEFVRNQFLEAGVDPEKITAVHNGIDLSQYPPATDTQRLEARRTLGLPEDAFITLFMGRLEVEKGIDVLLDAWRHLDLSPDSARLLIVGSAGLFSSAEGRLEALQDAAPPGCDWLPMRRDVLTPLHAADVLVMPSMWNEAFGRVVVEGLAAGLPSVASRVGAVPEILSGFLADFIFEKGSSTELADRLASLVDWRTKRPELGQQCAQVAAERFGIATMVDKVEAVLQRAVGDS